MSYPLLATTVALPSPIDVEQLARLAEQSGVDADALHEEVERRPLPQLSRARIDALLRVQEALAETVSRQVSQEYATAYNVLVEAVERWESDRTLTRRSLQLQHANERLRDLNRLKSEFLANVSHELKTPMTSIIGFTSLLLRGGAGELTEKAERFLNRVLANARTLHAAINDILDLAHLDSRDVRLEPTSFELAPLVDECVEDIRPAVGDKPIELHVDVSAGCTTLTTDRDRLRQVLLSLLKNAAKFTHRGEIRVSAEPVSGEDGPWVHIAVSDTGVGLPSKALPHIFEEFRQVDGSSTRLHGGAGLGLALVRKLTDLLGGEVTVDSRPDEGSTFSVTIPADLGRFQQRRQALKDLVLADEPDLADRDSPVVLAVCYHPQTILDMRAWVAPHDYRVASAFDIDEALERARAIVPYAILLNILSPGQDVWELMDELRADPRTTDVPVVVSSSLGRPELAEAVGAVDWLPRRLTPDTLLNALDRLRTDEAGSVLAIVGDPAARDGLRRALRQAGYHISACATCADATHFARNHYDAIVLDPQAEGQGELTALGTLRAGSQASVPIVAYVPPSFPDDERDYLAGQVDAVLDQSQAGPNEVVETIARLRHRAAGRHEES